MISFEIILFLCRMRSIGEENSGHQSQAGGLPAHVLSAQQRERDGHQTEPVSSPSQTSRYVSALTSPHNITPRPRQSKMEKIKHHYYKFISSCTRLVFNNVKLLLNLFSTQNIQRFFSTSSRMHSLESLLKTTLISQLFRKMYFEHTL